MPYLLDTSAAILLRDDDPVAIEAMSEIADPPFISAITKVELEGGVYAYADMQEQRRRRLDILLDIMPLIDFDSEMASAYGRLVERHGFSRRKIIDRMIAATAIVRGLTLITSNASDFADIDNLSILVWKS